jgi:hypothetical protein
VSYFGCGLARFIFFAKLENFDHINNCVNVAFLCHYEEYLHLKDLHRILFPYVPVFVTVHKVYRVNLYIDLQQDQATKDGKRQKQ